MKRFSHLAVGILQGSEILFSDFEDGGEMWTGDGPRQHRYDVRFEEAFHGVPIVHIGLSMWDIDSNSNQRADIGTEDVTRDGFTIIFRTWGDTRVARVRADWLAIGPTRFDEDFEV
ncbi:hypothetical protein FQV27_04370 [Paracoccus aurantiacus]|uniref:H-type lectin domain-containing protein n=1 Tax=Paracoccus aurantiacus TaxID=2599412 RepID=A0A5C6S9K4_9RHOB|nr:H-type lectin domain-containing protein [Paracoccus aurantiacus]TXB71088.1 hypothetical protein FQV27_04370 [Paracoccus aurantiacus]